MKYLVIFAMCCLLVKVAHAQELFINTEPASNMPANSLGLRLNGEGFTENGIVKSQINPEIMFGASSKLMLHANVYINDWYSNEYKIRGINIYAKYRFLSFDKMQEHFRMAAFARVSTTFQPGYNSEVDIEGDYKGLNAGIVATQLLHKLAISSTVAYTKILADGTDYLKSGDALSYTLSFGYLLLPKTYTGYHQTNFNFYFELLGKTQWSSLNGIVDNRQIQNSYLDAAPGVQFIFNSITRLDVSWRTQLTGNMNRIYYNLLLIRLEHNIFNVIQHK